MGDPALFDLPSQLIDSLATHRVLDCKIVLQILKALLHYLLAPGVFEKSKSVLILHPLYVSCFSLALWELAESSHYLSDLKFQNHGP